MRLPKHEEYTIHVRSPYMPSQCLFAIDGTGYHCHNDGEFALTIINDRNEIMLQYANICGAHMLITILDHILGY
jgi:hypothetical protein